MKRINRVPAVLLLLAIASLLVSACGPAAPAKPQPDQGAPQAAQPADTPTAKPAPQQAAPPAPARKESTPTPFALKIGNVLTSSAGALFLAEGKGYYKEQGLNVTFEFVTSAPEALANIAAGHIHVGSAAGAAFFNAVSRGTNVKVIGQTQSFDAKTEPTAPLIVRKDLWDSGVVRSIRDLKGKRVAVPGTGTAAEWLLDEAMKSGGLSAMDVDLVLMPFPDMPAAFANRGIDGAIAAEPFTTNLQEGGVATKIFKDYPPGTLITVIVMSGDLLRNNPELGERFMVAYLKAARDLHGDGWARDDNVALIAEILKLPPAQIKKSIPPYLDPNGKVDLESFQRQERFYMERGYLRYEKPLDPSTYYDETPARKAVDKLGVFK